MERFSTLSILLPFPPILGAWGCLWEDFYFWHEHLGPDALPDVTNGLRWASTPRPRWPESSALPLGHGCLYFAHDKACQVNYLESQQMKTN